MAKVYPKQYLQCKGVQHHWDEYIPSPGEFRRPEFGSRWVQRCDNCEGLRYSLVNRITGAILDTSWLYRMPEDYKPDQPMVRQDFRRKYFKDQAMKKNKRPSTQLRLVKTG